MTTLKELAIEMEASRNKMRKVGKDALISAFKEYFEKHPIVEKVLWTQYTPYFSDGDPCVFDINQFELRFFKDKIKDGAINKSYDQSYNEDEDEDYEDSPSYGEFYNKDYFDSEHKEAENDLSELESQCYEIDSVLKNVFGDHCLVVATREGFNVTEWEHE